MACTLAWTVALLAQVSVFPLSISLPPSPSVFLSPLDIPIGLIHLVSLPSHYLLTLELHLASD